jgi:DNA transformation protein
MGEKGARQSQAGSAMAEQLLDELAPLGAVTAKKMFGGYGVFADGVMFALVDSAGRAHLRADEATAPGFEAAGSDKHGRMPSWQIPDDVMADPDQLLAWAGRARDVAVAAKKR